MSEIIIEAMKFANMAHKGQLRKYSGLPYITHSMMVAHHLERAGMRDDVVAAGWLHDVVEDTEYTVGDIGRLFGWYIAGLVTAVTNSTTVADGNRKERKAIENKRIYRTSAEAKSIKLADIIDNCSTLVELDKEFAKVYLKEKREQLEYLKAGDVFLWNMANVVLLDNDF